MFRARTPARFAASAAHALLAVLASVWLVACGGGGGADDSLPPLGPGESAYQDPASYSTAAGASLPGAVEAAAVTRHSLTIGATTIAYTATAGHLIARAAANGAAEASVFYVAYTEDDMDPVTRPVTFFYNGGPGSSTVWLHLGSFGPVRLETGVPSTTAATPFPLVDNQQSLIGTTDLVFVDAVGTGLSEAIAPYTNRSFWGVDVDAALFRDFIVRWLAANGRQDSPKFLYGESYGGPRTAVLAGLLQSAGVTLDGLVLQSPALDYNSNCGVLDSGNCGANLPTYAAIGDYHGLLDPMPPDLDGYMAQMRTFADASYLPAVASWLQGTPPAPALPAALATYTGIAQSTWQVDFDLFPGQFQSDLLPGQIIGRYDGRMKAAVGAALAADGDPSSTFITPSFAATIGPYLRDKLRYQTASTYVVTSAAVESWNFEHAGRPLPDTVPDLAAALAQDPKLRVLMVGGYDDLATPFHVTELDLERLGADSRIRTRLYEGGHMSYLDDATRVRQLGDLVAFIAASAGQRAAAQGRRPFGVDNTRRPDHAGSPPAAPLAANPEPAVQTPLRDPWVPPKVREAALRALGR
jgi:carboxypeptidase C (cathepsin A)